MCEIILTTKSELKSLLIQVLIEYDKEKALSIPEKVFTINHVAKMLGKAHATIKKLVNKGIIKSTKDGLIPESAINDYLNQ